MQNTFDTTAFMNSLKDFCFDFCMKQVFPSGLAPGEVPIPEDIPIKVSVEPIVQTEETTEKPDAEKPPKVVKGNVTAKDVWPEAKIDIPLEIFQHEYRMFRDGKQTRYAAASRLGISVPTFKKRVTVYEGFFGVSKRKGLYVGVCRRCGESYTSTIALSTTRKYCPKCSTIAYREHKAEYNRNYRLKQKQVSAKKTNSGTVRVAKSSRVPA